MKADARRVAAALFGMTQGRSGDTHDVNRHAWSLGEVLGPRRSLRVAVAVTRAGLGGDVLVSMPPWFGVHLSLLDAAVATPPVFGVPLPWRGHRTQSAPANHLLRAVEHAWSFVAEPAFGLRPSWIRWLLEMEQSCTLEALARRDPHAAALGAHVAFFAMEQGPYGDPAARAEGSRRLYVTLDAAVREVVGLPAASVEGSPG